MIEVESTCLDISDYLGPNTRLKPAYPTPVSQALK